ncbi:MAG: hypothetical protein AAGA18_16150 [Verrucomicrobiota bacterium]
MTVLTGRFPFTFELATLASIIPSRKRRFGYIREFTKAEISA